jgi:hypothetical protein
VRKLVLIAAFALASVSAQAAERIDRVPAEIDAPAAAATPAAAPPPAATPQVSRKQVSTKQASRQQAVRKQASRAGKTWRETDEQKARQIAAQYGISW